MNILFLDIDGVVIPLRCNIDTRRKEWFARMRDMGRADQTGYGFFDPIAVTMLNDLHKQFNFHIVVSSSWAEIYTDRRDFEAIFSINGLNIPMHEDWKTPRKEYPVDTRADQIFNWLQEHPDVNKYIVLDDRCSGSGNFALLDNVFLCDDDNGMLWNIYNGVRGVCRGWDDL